MNETEKSLTVNFYKELQDRINQQDEMIKKLIDQNMILAEMLAGYNKKGE